MVNPAHPDIVSRLRSSFHKDLYQRTLESLLDRVEADGFFQESLTGRYPGMFPRTVGGLVSLFLETGDLDRCERLVRCVLSATAESGMERVPHVFDRRRAAVKPVSSPGAVMQPEHPAPLLRLDSGYAGAQPFTAPSEPLRAVEAFVSGRDCPGVLVLDIHGDPEREPLAQVVTRVRRLARVGQWVRFRFPSPLLLPAGQQFFLGLRSEGTERAAWWGLAGVLDHPLAGVRVYEKNEGIWKDFPEDATAFALDTGCLRHRRRSGYPILCARDQIDGQAHIIMAWARLAGSRSRCAFEDSTYPQVAKLLDRSIDWPYVATGYPTDLGLVRNVCLEHSREGRMWDAYDLLTQCFVGAALESMSAIARRRGDWVHAVRWQGMLSALRAAVEKHLTRQLEGRKVYLEMRLPNGGAGFPFEGMGWLNLSPVAAQWEPLERQVLRDTVAALRDRALFTWQGKKALAMDWNPDGTIEKVALGKLIGWEIDYSHEEGETDRILEWLDFLEAVNDTPLYMEIAMLRADDTWRVGDPGNGEQCAWWCWAMARMRRSAGLNAR